MTKKLSILIVEDEIPIAIVLQKALEAAGFAAQTVASGAAALERLRRDDVDLVLLDQNLPDMLGSEIVAALGERLRTLPVIVVTAHGDEKLAVDMLKAGAADYLRKDVELAFVHDLPKTVRATLDRFALEAENRRLQESLKKAHEELERRVEDRTAEVRLLAAVCEQAAESILITDIAGKIEYVNAAFEQVAGYTRDEVLGKNPRILKSGRQDQAFYQGLWETISRGEVWRGSFVNRNKDGSLYEEDAVVFGIRDESGEIVRYAAVKRDISRQVELEAQLRQAQKMEAVGTLAGGIAHDFNNQLTGILGEIELALVFLPSDPPVAEHLGNAREAVFSAAELTQHLLTLSRKRKPVMGPTDLGRVVQRTAKLLQRSIPESIEVRVHVAAELPVLRADAAQLEQALLNLAINARDAMPTGGVLTLEAVVVELDGEEAGDAERQGSHAVVTVADTGCGMPPEVLERIFEPFYTTKDPGEGTGLGLAMVYGCVEGHGGRITVDSSPENGTTFRLHLPVVAPEAAVRPPAREVPLSGSETILLVDDTESVLRTVPRLLEVWGYKVLTARDGEEALAVLAAHEGVALIVTDLVMPRRGGRELLAAVRAKGKRIPVVATSGYGLQEDQLRADGFAALLAKPYQMEVLARTLRDVLDRTPGS